MGLTMALNFVWSLDLKVNYHIQASAFENGGNGCETSSPTANKSRKKEDLLSQTLPKLSKKVPF